MLLGVLDIGSNSAQLQVFEARSGAPPLPTHAVKEPTLLGEAFGPDGAIDPAGVDRVVVAVNKAMTAARQLGVQLLYVFTTSAVRDAANRDLILDRVEAEAGVRPQYLSGEAEARLTYLAVHEWYGWSAGRLHYLQTTFNQPFDLPLRPLSGSAYEADPLDAPYLLDGARRRLLRPELTQQVSASLDG